MLTLNMDYFRSKPVNVPKITILVDHGYHLAKIIAALQQVYPQILSKVRFKQSPKPSKAEKVIAGKSGFVPVRARWIIERSNAWMERCEILVKNHERTLANAVSPVPETK
jgi:hypothetical protein